VFGAESLWGSRALHGRYVLRERERVAVYGEQRLRAELGLREWEMQLRAAVVLFVGVVGCNTTPAAVPGISDARPVTSAAPSASAEPKVIPGEPLGSNVSNAATTSSSNVPDADRVVVGLRPKFKACYDAWRKDGPHVAGMVTFSVRIGKDGHVAATSLTRRNSLPMPMVDCIRESLSGAVFAPLTQDEIVIVPVRFEVPDDG
jgi:hypothetical protein